MKVGDIVAFKDKPYTAVGEVIDIFSSGGIQIARRDGSRLVVYPWKAKELIELQRRNH